MRSADKEALVHKCLTEHYEKYYRIAYSYTFQEQDAMDIVQEGAYRAILKSDSLKKPEYADTWICRIMMNEAVRFLEKYRGRTTPMEELPEEGREDQMEDLDLRRALKKLSEMEQRIVVLRYFEEEKLTAIAKIMDLKESTVKSSLYRAVEKLKKYMKAGGAEYGKVEKRV
ncbi:MAG: sigma-70 family RNA polymerase sigma factor [Lachnospiraceae bacterium]|nr:sigma-70 family RNA polymerase sigma factor [Lachnospiraceae bacterium]